MIAAVKTKRGTERKTTHHRPVTFSQLMQKARHLFVGETEAADWIGFETVSSPTCSTVEYAEYLDLLSKADLSEKQKDLLASVQKLVFQHTRTTADGHFTLKWDSTGTYRVTDAIVNDAEADLQDAYAKYNTDFGQPPSAATVEVLFDNARTPQTVAPAGPISLPAQYMMQFTGNRLLRKITATHELFHVLQGGFGFEVNKNSKWFYEGGATWSEVIYYNAISGDFKLSYFFAHPFEPIRNLVYGSVSFFIFLENFFFTTKTGAWFMVDWFQWHKSHGAAGLFSELSNLAKSLIPDYDSDRLLVQFGVQAAAKTWFKTVAGAVGVPPPRIADNPPGYPVQQYTNMNLSLPNSNIISYNAPAMTGIRITDPSLTRTQIYIWKVTGTSATTPYSVFGQFSAGQRKNPFVGAAIVNPATGAPVPGHPTEALSTALNPVDFNFIADVSSSEMAYFVTAGPAAGIGKTTFTLDIGTH